jgi:hypothetical protein
MDQFIFNKYYLGDLMKTIWTLFILSISFSSFASSTIKGQIGQTFLHDGKVYIEGFACLPKNNKILTVKLFSKNPQGNYTYIKSALANLSNENPIVSGVCKNGDQGNSFVFKLSLSQAIKYRNKPIQIQAFSGSLKKTLDRSNLLKFPSYTDNRIIGEINKPIATPFHYVIKGEACHKNSNKSLPIQVYVQMPNQKAVKISKDKLTHLQSPSSSKINCKENTKSSFKFNIPLKDMYKYAGGKLIVKALTKFK